MKYFVILFGLLILVGFTGTAFASHGPDQPQFHPIRLPSDMKEKTFEEFMEWCEPNYGELCIELEKKRIPNILSPLKQFKSGMSINEIRCKESLTLIPRHDGSPACVKEQSIPKLIERGWANGAKIENEWTVSYYPNGRSLPNGTFDTNLENVVPWLMMQELEQQGVKNWRNDPSTGAHTDEGWSNPSKMCSSLFVDVKTKLYVSSAFYSEPELFISEIIIDDSKPTDCQKWFSIPYGVDSKTGSLLYDYDEKSKSEHYEIEITGLKDVYIVGERYDFSYIISGYGYSCGGTKITFPDQNGELVGIVSSPLCAADASMREFVFDIPQEYADVELKNPGTYTVTVTFDKPSKYFPTTVSKEFRVVEE